MPSNVLDSTPPTLTSLDLPAQLDLSQGHANLEFGATGTDNLTQIDQVWLYFDRPISWSYRPHSTEFASYDFLPLYGSFDDWSDGVNYETRSLSAFNAPGVYTVERVAVKDVAGNERSYSTTELQALGFNTQIEFVGSPNDASPPTLTSIDLPAQLDLSQGPANLEYGVTGMDDLTQIDDVLLYFDRPISWSYRPHSTEFASYDFLPLYGSFDDWSDGVNYETRSLSPFNAPGVYTVERVAVKDVAGNERSYSTTELQALGFNTQIELSGPKPKPGQAVARGPGETIELVEGQSANLSVSFQNLTNSSFSYRYYLTGDDSTASPGDFAAASGSGRFTVASTAPETRTLEIPVSATFDTEAEEVETLQVVVELTGLTFADGRSVASFPVSISDNRPLTGEVAILGEAAAGGLLQADLSGLSDPEGLNPGQHRYQWLRDGVEIDGATDASRTLTRQDAGADIALRVTVEDVFGAAGTRTSDAVAVDPTLGGEVTIHGTDPAGVQLSIQGAAGLRTVEADADGVFRYATTDRTEIAVSAEKSAADVGAAITALDALAALRLASGLALADGPADAFDFIAADADRNGRVTARDALEILRHSVGLDTEFAPDWVFLDMAADVSQIATDRVEFEEGHVVQDFAAEPALALQAVLLGDVDATLWSDVPA